MNPSTAPPGLVIAFSLQAGGEVAGLLVVEVDHSADVVFEGLVNSCRPIRHDLSSRPLRTLRRSPACTGPRFLCRRWGELVESGLRWFDPVPVAVGGDGGPVEGVEVVRGDDCEFLVGGEVIANVSVVNQRKHRCWWGL